MATNTKGLTEKKIKILDYLKLKGVGVKLTYTGAAKELGYDKPISIISNITNFAKKGLVDKEKVTEIGEDGKKKEVGYFWLTEAGMAFDPNAEASE